MIEDRHENIAVIPHRGGELRIGLARQLKNPEGSRLAALQVWRQSGSELAPIGKPIYFRREELPDAIFALQSALDVLDLEFESWKARNGHW